jgi:acyl-coenzyme A thioesterase PaaI-like protein
MSSSKQGFYSKVALSPNVFRHVMNCWPPFWGTRIHIEEIAPDWRYVRTRMKLSMRNKNYVGSHFGGGMFAMTDPFYMVALKNILGEAYLVWDKAATIDYVKPGRTTVYAEFIISEEQLAEIYAKTADGEKFEPVYQVDVVDADQQLVARVHKTLYIRKRPAREARAGAVVGANGESKAASGASVG